MKCSSSSSLRCEIPRFVNWSWSRPMFPFAVVLREVPHETLYTTDGVKRATKNIDLGEVFQWFDQDPIWAQRGKAVQGYAQLEFALSSVFGSCGRMPHDTAMTLFYKITNTQARNAMIEKLLHKRHKNKFNPFWNGYIKALRAMDIKRNEIIHWVAAANVGIDAENIIHAGLSLIHPANMIDGEATIMGDAPRLLINDMVEFEKKCGEFAGLASMFVMATDTHHDPNGALMTAWRDIFQQPFLYPLPADHLLFPKPSAPDNQLRSSPA